MLPRVLSTVPQVRGRNGETEGVTWSSEEDSGSGIRNCQQPAQNLAKVHGDEADLSLFKIPVDQVYNAIKGREIIWTRDHSRPTRKDQEPVSIALFTVVWAIVP